MYAFQIPDNMESQLDELAASTGQSRDDLVLEALVDRLRPKQEDKGLPPGGLLPSD